MQPIQPSHLDDSIVSILLNLETLREMAFDSGDTELHRRLKSVHEACLEHYVETKREILADTIRQSQQGMLSKRA